MKNPDQERQIRLIVLDLDGTLLNSNKQISPENYAALTRAAEAGVYIVPSTGRFFGGMPQTVRELPFLHYAITVNGAEVYDVKNDRVLHSALIPVDMAVEMFAFMDTLPVVYDCYQNGWGWMERELYDKAEYFTEDPHMLKMIRELRTPVDDLKQVIRSRGTGIQKTQMFFQDMELRRQMLEEVPRRFPRIRPTSSMVNNIEMNIMEANKGDALLELCRRLEIDPKDTMAFGDGLNDVTMLKAAGIGVAMGNADDQIKAEADYVTSTNDEHGVAKAILKFCFGE